MKIRYRQIFSWLFWGLAGLSLTTVCQAQQPGQPKLSIDQAIQIAMTHSLQRQVAQDDVKIARDKVTQTVSAYGPKLTIDGGFFHYNELPTTVKLAQGLADLNNGLSNYHLPGLSYQNGPSDALDYYGYQAQLTQPLYTGNKLTATNKQAKANEANARANLVAKDNDLALSVKKAFYTVLLCQQLKVTMDEAVASMENHLKEANAYYKADLVPQLDVLRAEGKLADLKQKQLLAQNNLALAKASFNFVVGVDPATVYEFDDQMGCGTLPETLNACQAEALTLRPELEAANAKIEMARQAIVIAKSGNKPTVALVANGHHFEPETESPSVKIGLIASLQLYDSGMIRHQVTETEDTLKQALTGKELLRRGIQLEVEQAYRNAEVAAQTIKVAQKNLATAQETLRVAETRYKVGLSTSLERLDAEVGLTQAKTSHTQALSMYNIALAELERAIGKNNLK
jgi:outer membrane protein